MKYILVLFSLPTKTHDDDDDPLCVCSQKCDEENVEYPLVVSPCMESLVTTGTGRGEVRATEAASLCHASRLRDVWLACCAQKCQQEKSLLMFCWPWN